MAEQQKKTFRVEIMVDGFAEPYITQVAEYDAQRARQLVWVQIKENKLFDTSEIAREVLAAAVITITEV